MKTKFFAIAAVAALFSASCTEAVLQTGAEVTVSFVAKAPEAIATKAFSDGETAKNLYYAVYAEDSKNVLLQGETTFTDLKAQVELTLVTGKVYDIIFWAQSNAAPYTFDMAAQTMTVNYTGVAANDENLDAFYKTVDSYKVAGPKAEDVVLTRPFAQINVGTNDTADAFAAGYTATKTNMGVANVPNVLNLKDGSVTGEAVVNFAPAAIPSGETFPVAGYDYLAMDYVLAAADKTTTTVNFVIYGENEIPFTLTNVPVQRNYRTNIYGSLLTNSTVWNVEIDPMYETPDYNQNLVEVATEAELANALANGESVKLLNDLTIVNSLVVGSSAVLDLNGKTISNDTDIFKDSKNEKVWSLVSVQEGTLTIKGNGTLKAKENDCYAVDVRNGATVIIEDGTFAGNWSCIYVRQGHAVIKGGQYSIQQTSNVDGKPYEYVLNIYGEAETPSSITVTGGTFHKFNPADNAAEGDHTNYVPAGYKSVANGEIYTVVAE